MAEEFPIIVSIDPAPANKAADRVIGALGDIEKKGASAGAAVSKSLGDGLRSVDKAAAAAGASVQRALSAGTSARAASPVSDLLAELNAITAFGKANAKGFAPSVGAGGALKEVNALISGMNGLAHETRAAGAMFDDMAQKSSGLTTSLRALVPVLGAAFVAKKIGDYSDSFVNLQNKLAVVTDSSEELKRVTADLYKQSQANRISFEGTAALYSRLANTTAEMGISQAQLLAFTDQLGKAVKISGASAAEANNAMIQLSQGLASGTLRGDELRSVLEQLPTVADVIAKGLGVTRGRLRELGAEGKITSKDIIRSFSLAEAELNDKFGKTVPTIADAITKLQNTLVMFAAKLQPIMGPLVQIFLTLVDVLGSVLTAFGPLIAVVGKLASVASGAVSAVSGLVTTITEGVSEAFGQVADDIASLGGNMSEYDAGLDQVKRTQEAVSAGMRGASADANLLGDTMLSDAEKTIKAVKAKEAAAKANRSLAESMLDPEARLLLIVERGQQADEMFKRLARTINEAMVNGAIAAFAAASKRAADELKKYRDELEGVLAAADPAAAAVALLSDQQETLNQAVRAGDLTQEQAAIAYDALAAAAESVIDPLGALERSLADETAEITFGLTAKKADIRLRKELNALAAAGVVVTDEQEAALRKQLERLDAAEKKRDKARSSSKASGNAAKDFARELQGILDAANPTAAAVRHLADQQDVLTKATAKYPARAAEFKAASEQIAAAARAAVDPIGAVTRGLEDELRLRTELLDSSEAGIRLREILADLDAKGVTTSKAQRDELASTLKFIELYGEAERRAAGAAEARREAASTSAAAVDAEWERRAKRFDEAAESQAAWQAELNNSLGGGLKAGIKEAAQDLVNVGDMVKGAFGSAVNGLEENLANAFMGAETNWSALADSILGDIAKIAAKMALLSLIGGIATGGSSFSVGAGQSALGDLFGFAKGGQFIVPGAGAQDSQVAAFKVSPRERVTIETEKQQRQNDRAAFGGGRGGDVSVVNSFVLDPRDLVRAVNTAEGRRHMAEAVRMDPRAFASRMRR